MGLWKAFGYPDSRRQRWNGVGNDTNLAAEVMTKSKISFHKGRHGDYMPESTENRRSVGEVTEWERHAARIPTPTKPSTLICSVVNCKHLGPVPVSDRSCGFQCPVRMNDRGLYSLKKLENRSSFTRPAIQNECGAVAPVVKSGAQRVRLQMEIGPIAHSANYR